MGPVFFCVLVCTDLVDAAIRTTVEVKASAYDTKNCNSSGCDADLTRDSDSEDEQSRWSCRYLLKDKNCKVWYTFGEPQYLDSISVAFHKGDERTRSFLVRTFNSDDTRQVENFTSSGATNGFESFAIGREDVIKLYIQPIDPNVNDWISIKEVSSFVK